MEASEKKKKLRQRCKNISFDYSANDWYIPQWGTRGGNNYRLLIDIKKPEEKRKYYFFKTTQMDFQHLHQYKQKKFRYPCYYIIKKIDHALHSSANGKTSGFKYAYPSKKFLKKYYLHICPDDDLALFETWTNYTTLTKSARKIMADFYTDPLIGAQKLKKAKPSSEIGLMLMYQQSLSTTAVSYERLQELDKTRSHYFKKLRKNAFNLKSNFCAVDGLSNFKQDVF